MQSTFNSLGIKANKAVKQAIDMPGITTTRKQAYGTPIIELEFKKNILHPYIIIGGENIPL